MPLEALLVMAVALGAGGLVKGATGMGLPAVAVPILASFLGVPKAVALMCLPILVTNAWQVWRFRADFATADFLPALILAGAVGVGLGTWLITSVPERGLSLGLAVMVLIYVGWALAKPHFTLSRPLVKVKDKEMPPNGAGIPDEELATLKKWVEEGAKFDGPDPAAAHSLVRTGTASPARR